MNALDGLIIARRMSAYTDRGEDLHTAQVAEPHAFLIDGRYVFGKFCPADIRELLERK